MALKINPAISMMYFFMTVEGFVADVKNNRTGKYINDIVKYVVLQLPCLPVSNYRKKRASLKKERLINLMC